MTIDYKYNEGDLLRQVTEYVNATYGQHYSQNKYQATEFIIDGGHGVGFTIGNIMKYAQRYSHKGTPEEWRKDLMKVVHYAIIALYVHDKTYGPKEINLTDLLKDVKIPTTDFSELNPARLKTSLSTVDTINIRPEDTIVPNWHDYNMGTTSLLTSDESSSITITGTKTKKKKG
jgi:hypothetical protein